MWKHCNYAAFHTADDSRSRIRRKQYCNSSDMALYPICRSVTLYRSTSACKTGWWEKNQPLAVAVWSLLFIIPFAVTYSAGDAVETVLECILNDYLTFIVLLFGLFCVAGNITLEGDLAGSPRVNVIFLAIGTLLSSCIGTTGASMLMVRPMIKMNSWRQHKSHIMVFLSS